MGGSCECDASIIIRHETWACLHSHLLADETLWVGDSCECGVSIIIRQETELWSMSAFTPF